MSKAKKLNAIIDKYYSKCQNKQRKCPVDGCNENAISSHLLQKNGIINHIATNQHVRQVSFDKFPTIKYKIKLIGVNQALTFKGFCSYHDSELFKSIEGLNIDFNQYRCQLLFTYRALLKEYREKEMMIDFYTQILNIKIDGLSQDIEGIKTIILGNQYMMWDLEFNMKCIYEDLFSNNRNFNFLAFSLPKIEICTSSAFSFSSLMESFTMKNDALKKEKPIPAVILNLIPFRDDTKLIIGYNKISEGNLKPKFDELKNFTLPNLLKELSDYLIRYFDMWACSETFYQNHIKPNGDELERLINFFTKENQFSQIQISFNLFGSLELN